MSDRPLPAISIGAARSNLTEVTSQVRHLETGQVLTHRGKPEAVLVPMSLWEAVQAAGGIAKAVGLLQDAVKPDPPKPL